MMKRFLALMLSVLLVVALLPASIFAEGEDSSVEESSQEEVSGEDSKEDLEENSGEELPLLLGEPLDDSSEDDSSEDDSSKEDSEEEEPVVISQYIDKYGYLYDDNDKYLGYANIWRTFSGYTVPASLSFEVTPEEKQAAINEAVDAVTDVEPDQRYMFDVALLDAEGNPVDVIAESSELRLYMLYKADELNKPTYYAYFVDEDGNVTDLEIIADYGYDKWSNGIYLGVYYQDLGNGTYVIDVEQSPFDSYSLEFVPDMAVSLEEVLNECSLSENIATYFNGSADVSSDNIEITGDAETGWFLALGEDFAGDEWVEFTFDIYPTLHIDLDLHTEHEGALEDDDPLPAQEEESASMMYHMYNDWYDFDRCEFDVQGVFNGSYIRTTYSDQGYENYISVDGVEYGGVNQKFGIETLGEVYTISNVQFKVNAKLVDDGDVVKYTYTIFNNSATTKNITVGNGTDVQIGSNDDARITISNNGQLISMVDDTTGNASSGLEYLLYADETTPFTGVWIGYYGDRYDDSSVYKTCMEDGYLEGEDSGLTFHWDLTLQPGEKATRTCYFQVKSTLVVTDPKLTANAETDMVEFSVPFTDTELRDVTLYYTLEGLEEATTMTSLGEGETAGEFEFEADASSWDANTYRAVTLYAVDNVGYRSKVYNFKVWWPEFKPDTVYSTLSFDNTSENFASVYGEVGSTIVLPEDSNDSKDFYGWNTEEDGTGTTYLANTEYTMTDSDVTLYAQWKIPVENVEIIAENQPYSGDPTEPVVVKLGTKTLEEGKDYFVEYSDNVEPGTVTARIYGGLLEGETTVSYKVTPVVLNVEGTEVEDKPYDGTLDALVTPGAISGFIPGHDDVIITPVATFSTAGIGKNKTVTVKYVLTGSDAKYYTIPDEVFQVEITRAEVTVTADKLFKIYGEEDPYLTATVSSVCELEDFAIQYNVSREEGEDYGAYVVTVEGEALQGNYEVTFVNGVFNIVENGETIYITAASGTKEYDGTELKNDTFVYTQDVLASGDVLEAAVEGSIKEVGTASNKVTSYRILRGDQDVTKHYMVEVEDGTLTITAKEDSDAQPNTDDLNKVLEDYKNKEEYKDDSLAIVMRFKTDGEIPQEDKQMIEDKIGGKNAVYKSAELIMILNGTTEINIGDENEELIGVTYDFDFTNKTNIQVFRVHTDAESNKTLDEITETPTNADGEYVDFNEKAGKITIYASKYSTFAITYDTTKDVKTGDTSNMTLYIIIAAVALCAIAATGFTMRKKAKG